MRATVAALGLAIIVGLVKLLHPRKKETVEPCVEELGIAKGIIEKSERAYSNLVLLGDKELLISPTEKSFIMFSREGRSWISLGDPVGPKEEAEEMIWEFHDECEREGYKPVFYHVGREYLEYYVDLGLTLFKLGEEARIPLADFDPKYNLESSVESAYKEFKNASYQWEVLSPKSVKELLPALKTISDANIQSQKRRERGFAVGYFDQQYLSNFPTAVVKKDGNIVAFSNLLQGANNYEMATDLLRYHPEISDGIINFMLVEAMLWGRQQGYRWFNLGMAPLSGMDEHDFSPGWNKFADFVYTYGENFYGFKTVRAYKSRFNPVWEPKFLVCPGGWTLPGVLSNLTNIISGEFTNIIANKE
jgi:phosphatidylglycerol lysyltransferase